MLLGDDARGLPEVLVMCLASWSRMMSSVTFFSSE